MLDLDYLFLAIVFFFNLAQIPIQKIQHSASLCVEWHFLCSRFSSINITVPRVGGAFGGKSWDSCAFSAAATLAAYLTGRLVILGLT